MTPFTKIVKEWRLKSWPAGITSTVTISIKQNKEDTKILIKQTGVPVKEVIMKYFLLQVSNISYLFVGGIDQRRLAQILPSRDEAIIWIRNFFVLECFVICEKIEKYLFYQQFLSYFAVKSSFFCNSNENFQTWCFLPSMSDRGYYNSQRGRGYGGGGYWRFSRCFCKYLARILSVPTEFFSTPRKSILL